MEEVIEDRRPYFKRLHICYEPCKKSFKLFRNGIGLEGWFLKGIYGGKILASIGRGPNDQMLPIAFVVVERKQRIIGHGFWNFCLMILEVGISVFFYTFTSSQQKCMMYFNCN